MADAFTPTLNLTKPEINQSINTWGNKLNGDMDLLDQFAQETQADVADLQDRVEALEAVAVPAGLIAMWSGAENAVPAGWALCNGSNGTPNLRDKFVVAAGPTRGVGTTGGADSQTVGTSAAGAHAHGGATAGTAISEAQMPPHQHGGSTDAQGYHAHNVPNAVGPVGASILQGGSAYNWATTTLSTEAGGVHVHNIATDFRGG
ncbi:MAG TPA: hypothetical protein VGM87_17455, partial [Roseomonas sp.]